MTDNGIALWEGAKDLPICTGSYITGGFSVGFDKKVPRSTMDELMQFIYWVWDKFSVPITLWVDCIDRKYLINQARKRAGYRFWCVEFKDYPHFDEPDDIPVIELAANRPIEEILPAFIEALTLYYAWLSRKDITPDKTLTETILKQYHER